MSELDSSDLATRLTEFEWQLQALRAQVLRLERPDQRVRSYRIVLVAALAVPLTLTWLGSELRAEGPGTTIKAPFTVVNRANRPIVRIYEEGNIQGLNVSNKTGNVAAGLIADGDAGKVFAAEGRTTTAVSEKTVALEYLDQLPRLMLNSGNGSWATIEANALNLVTGTDSPAVKITSTSSGGKILTYGKSGKPVIRIDSGVNDSGFVGLSRGETPTVAIGATKEGGTLRVFDTGGVLRTEVGPLPGFKAYSPAGQVLAEFGLVPSANNGHLRIGNASGDALIEGGMLIDGKGTIRVGPYIGGPPSGMVIPDRLVGHTK